MVGELANLVLLIHCDDPFWRDAKSMSTLYDSFHYAGMFHFITFV